MKFQNEWGEWLPKPSATREKTIDDTIVLYTSEPTSPHPEGHGGQTYRLERFVYATSGQWIGRIRGWVEGGIVATSDPRTRLALRELDQEDKER